MAKEELSPMDERKAAERRIAEIDLARAEKVQAIFEGKAFQAALAELQAIGDPNDTAARTRGARADVNALVTNLSVPLLEGAQAARDVVSMLNTRLNPPVVGDMVDPNAPAAGGGARRLPAT